MATKKKAAPAAVAAIDTPETAADAGNKYAVADSVWRKWNDAQRALFHDLYRYMFDNQLLFKHPKAPMLQNEQWKTTAWNAAWMAADLLKKD